MAISLMLYYAENVLTWKQKDSVLSRLVGARVAKKKKYDHNSICLLIALASEVFRILCDSFSISFFSVEDFFRDVEGNMFEDIMHNHVGLPHLLPAPEKNSSNNDLVENDDDQIVSESSNSAVFPQISFICTLTKCPKRRRTMSFQNFEKFRVKKKPLVRPTKQPLLRPTKQPLLRPTKPNMLRPAVHKSQHHSSIASRQQSLVSSVSDSERYVHSTAGINL